MQDLSANEAFLQSVRQRDMTAFNTLYNRYAPALYGDVCRNLHIQKVADETLTGAFVKIWNSMEQFDPSKEKLFTWSLKMVREEICQTKVNLAMEALFSCRRPAEPALPPRS